jgi:hypothetical protein
MPMNLTAVNRTHFSYSCHMIPMNKTSCIAVAIVGSSLALMVRDGHGVFGNSTGNTARALWRVPALAS